MARRSTVSDRRRRRGGDLSRRTGLAAGTSFVRNITDPTLTVFAPEPASANGVGIVVAPGGGWTINVWSHEGLDVARWLVGAGYTTFLLKYRVQASDPDQEAFEARMAVVDAALRRHGDSATSAGDRRPDRHGRVPPGSRGGGGRWPAGGHDRREQAARFGVRRDAVGMIGFSAGAFLAVDLALDPAREPLAFVGAIYGGETRGAPVPADAPRCSRSSPTTTSCARSSRVCTPTGRRPTGRRSCTCSPRCPRLRHGPSGPAVGCVDGSVPRLAR